MTSGISVVAIIVTIKAVRAAKITFAGGDHCGGSSPSKDSQMMRKESDASPATAFNDGVRKAAR